MIVDDDWCELCDEPALPYEDTIDYPLCAGHKIELETGWAWGDFEIDIRYLIIKIFKAVHRGDFQDLKRCAFPGCRKVGHSRHNKDVYLQNRSVVSFCTRHAAHVYIPTTLLDVEIWMLELDFG